MLLHLLKLLIDTRIFRKIEESRGISIKTVEESEFFFSSKKGIEGLDNKVGVELRQHLIQKRRFFPKGGGKSCRFPEIVERSILIIQHRFKTRFKT